MKFLRFLTFALAATVMFSSCEEAEEAVDDLIEDLTDDDSTTDDSTTDDSTTDDSTTDDSTTDDSTTDDSTTDDSTTDDSTTDDDYVNPNAPDILSVYEGGIVYSVSGDVVKVISLSAAQSLYWLDASANNIDIPDNDTSILEGSTLTASILAASNYSDTIYPAVAYCNNLAESGYTDWYLPSEDELKTIFNIWLTDSGVTLDAAFVAGGASELDDQNYHWSSTEDTEDIEKARATKIKSDFGSVLSGAYDKVKARPTRCGRTITLATE